MQDLDHARSLLVEILRRRSPRLGAPLKIELRREFELTRGQQFDERRWGFARFSDFLRANSHLVAFSRKPGASDVEVSLIQDGGLRSTPAPGGSVRSVVRRLPAALWQALTNPDPRRKRYYDRENRRIVHFLVPGESPVDRQLATSVDENGGRFVEISPVPEARQKEWMLDFLESLGLPLPTKEPLLRLLGGDYNSKLNAVFGNALGQQGDAWRAFRTGRVLEAAQAWASRVNIDLGEVTTALETHSGFSLATSTKPAVGREQRALLHRLIDELGEEELGRVLVPLSVVRLLGDADTRDTD